MKAERRDGTLSCSNTGMIAELQISVNISECRHIRAMCHTFNLAELLIREGVFAQFCECSKRLLHGRAIIHSETIPHACKKKYDFQGLESRASIGVNATCISPEKLWKTGFDVGYKTDQCIPRLLGTSLIN